MRLLNLLLAAAVLGLALTGCASMDRSKWSAERYYQEAKEALDSGLYDTAVKYYEELEAAYPYGPYAEQAQLDIAYAYYKSGEPESAIAAADRFIKLHPRHPEVDYAYYLRGLASFEQNRNFLYSAFNQKPEHRDPSGPRRAFNYFSELVQKFPDSKYAEDAVQRMVHLRNGLARYEVYVANYYLEREAYVAAANRAKYVVENYPRTASVADALVVMGLAYRHMGMDDLADDALRVLRSNYAGHPGIERIESVGK